MTTKDLLGLNKSRFIGTHLCKYTDVQIMNKIVEADHRDADSVEFDIENRHVTIRFPHVVPVR